MISWIRCLADNISVNVSLNICALYSKKYYSIELNPTMKDEWFDLVGGQ